MKTADIAKVAGLSHATVYKILYLKDRSKYKFHAETIAKVEWLKKINEHLEVIFKSAEFNEICDLVIKKIGKRDSKNYIEIIDLARSSKNLNRNKNHGIVKQFFCSAYDIFIDSDFYDMCMFAVSKARNGRIREQAYELAELSRAIRRKLK